MDPLLLVICSANSFDMSLFVYFTSVLFCLSEVQLEAKTTARYVSSGLSSMVISPDFIDDNSI
jgi:hypothetical protein